MAQKPSVNPFKLLLRRLPKPLRNPYIFSLCVFGLLLVFVDKHNFITQWKLYRSVQQLETDKAYYEEQIKKAQVEKQQLENNKERFAREQYHMHKSNEEVFVIPEEDE